MFEYTVMNVVQCTALLNQNQEGFGHWLSSCTVPNYIVLMSKYFKCILGTLRISGGVGNGPGVQMQYRTGV